MGTAALYAQWDDPGMAFSEDALAGFVSSAAAEGRVNWLLEQVLVIERYTSIHGAAKEQWWRKVQAKMVDVVTWYCRVGELPGIDRGSVRELPEATSAEGKRLTVLAQRLDAAAFMAQWEAEVRTEMRVFVSITRRAAGVPQISGWTKAEKKKCNRIANGFVKEMMTASACSSLLNSLTS